MVKIAAFDFAFSDVSSRLSMAAVYEKRKPKFELLLLPRRASSCGRWLFSFICVVYKAVFSGINTVHLQAKTLFPWTLIIIILLHLHTCSRTQELK